jgi:hypothetical protein
VIKKLVVEQQALTGLRTELLDLAVVADRAGLAFTGSDRRLG